MFKNQNGLTLIALIITIIVMIILAGVSLSLTTGDDGVLNKAKLAREETRAGQVKEILDLWVEDTKIAREIGTNDEEPIDEVINRLHEDGLLTVNEVNDIRNKENVNKEVKIGNQTISFNYDSNYDKKTEESLKYLTITADGEVNIKNAEMYYYLTSEPGYYMDGRYINGRAEFPLEEIVIPEKINGITVTSLGEKFVLGKGVKVLRLPKTLRIFYDNMEEDWDYSPRFGYDLEELYVYSNLTEKMSAFLYYVKVYNPDISINYLDE